MNHRAMQTIVESQQNRTNGIREAEDSEADGQRRRYGHQKELPGRRLFRLPETIANPPFQTGRRLHAAHRIL
ncbi:MAG TPA: hypothetical protein VL285_20910 [Bryobacteraceae bacterium]|nr:hypothetical protein [Bryobacteraceae bacterium]